LANQIAVKLKKFAFNITTVKNFTQTSTGTNIYVLGTGEYQETVKMLKTFLPINEIITTPDPLLLQTNTGVDLLLVLGNTYVDQLAVKPFSYYK
jgi:hypothetical protein